MKDIKQYILERDANALQESLFDKDIIKKLDIKLGELYEISPVSHHCGVTNNIRNVLGMFDKKSLNRANFPLHVREDCSFIEYWSDDNPELIPFINMIFNLPMSDINKVIESQSNGIKYIFSTLEKYYAKNGRDAKHIYVSGRKFGDSLIEITVYDNLTLGSPSSIKLTFEKR